ncbi:hypothetical protein IS636_003723 [Vibrio cholerae]
MLIKFKASAEPSEIEKLKGLFASMPDKVDGVLSGLCCVIRSENQTACN